MDAYTSYLLLDTRGIAYDNSLVQHVRAQYDHVELMSIGVMVCSQSHVDPLVQQGYWRHIRTPPRHAANPVICICYAHPSNVVLLMRCSFLVMVS